MRLITHHTRTHKHTQTHIQVHAYTGTHIHTHRRAYTVNTHEQTRLHNIKVQIETDSAH